MTRDAAFMRLALALGRRGLGRTWPNPSVGAVIVAPQGRGRAMSRRACSRWAAGTKASRGTRSMARNTAVSRRPFSRSARTKAALPIA